MESIEIKQIGSGDQIQSVAVAGSGPLIILMHGWPELGLSYRHQMAPLAKAGFTVAAPDMRGYGGTFKPSDPRAYTIDAEADDMAVIAAVLGAKRWVAVGHDWGSPVAWRCALRFPDQVAAVYSLSVPHLPLNDFTAAEGFELGYPNRFYYMRYFQEVGVGEAELECDPRDALKRIYYAFSGDVPHGEWLKERPLESKLLPGLAIPPPGPLSFMPDDILDQYAEAFTKNGFFGPLCWYRNLDASDAQARAYGDLKIRQPVGFICGTKEIVLLMAPDGTLRQRELCSDIRCETMLPGAGHWLQQERPHEVTESMIAFLKDVRSNL